MNRWILVCFLTMACHEPTPIALRIDAAKAFTNQSNRNDVPPWPLEAHAVGSDCDVLLIEAKVPLDTRMVEAAHYAAPGSNEDAVQAYAKNAHFRGVVYKDSLKRYWTYGTVAKADAPALQPCH